MRTVAIRQTEIFFRMLVIVLHLFFSLVARRPLPEAKYFRPHYSGRSTPLSTVLCVSWKTLEGGAERKKKFACLAKRQANAIPAQKTGESGGGERGAASAADMGRRFPPDPGKMPVMNVPLPT